MTINEQFKEYGVVPVVVLNDAKDALPLAKALVEGGLACAEVTFRTDAAEESIRLMSEAYPEMLVGAGTVLTIDQVNRAVKAGAKFIVSPGFDPEIVDYCLENNIPVLPGCITPSEVAQAVKRGLKVVKFFPAEQAGGIAAEHIYPAIKDRLGKGQVRVGEVNQDATSANISERGMGFINKFIELAKADGYTVAVVGNDFYVNQVKDNGDQASADIILEVAVPAQTTVELCATEASNIMNKDDTIAMFGSNQVSAEGVLTANQNLNKLGTDEGKIVGAGFDAGSVLKAAVKDGTMLGAVTQSPLMQGKISIETLAKICDGESVEDVTTDGYWYDSTNMEDADIVPNLYD